MGSNGVVVERVENGNTLTVRDHVVWRRNSRYLYDLLLDRALEVSAMSAEFLPDIYRSETKDFWTHRIVVGFNGLLCGGSARNVIEIEEVRLPNLLRSYLPTELRESTLEYGGYVQDPTLSTLKTTALISHRGDIHRIRHLPQNPGIIASKGSGSSVYIFDYTRYTSNLSDKFACELELIGHKAGGFGISWNRRVPGRLVSGSDDGRICIWDVDGNTKRANKVNPLMTCNLKGGRDINDVSWSRADGRIFASVDSSGYVCLWDTSEQLKKPIKSLKHSSNQITCIEFATLNPFGFATAGFDGEIAFWDLRKLNEHVHRIKSHKGKEIRQLTWSPHDEAMVASAAFDNRVHLWNLKKINTSDDPNQPELEFVHAGHTSPLTDLSWNPNEKDLIISTEENNIMQIWKRTVPPALAENPYN